MAGFFRKRGFKRVIEMRLLVRTTSSDEYHDCECSYAIIDINRDLAKFIIARKELLQMAHSKAPELYSLNFWDSTPTYLSDVEELLGSEDSDDVIEYLDSHGSVVIEDGEVPPGERTECNMLVLNEQCFYWRCYPRWSAVHIETVGIPYERLLEVINASSE